MSPWEGCDYLIMVVNRSLISCDFNGCDMGRYGLISTVLILVNAFGICAGNGFEHFKPDWSEVIGLTNPNNFPDIEPTNDE